MTAEKSREVTSFSVSWRDIRDILLFVPVVHIAFCFVFLFFYSISYGHSLEAFFTPSDVLHVSFRDIAPGYLLLAVGLPLAIYVGKRIRRQEAAQPREKPTDKLTLRNRLLVVMFSASFFMLAGAAFYFALYWMLTQTVAISPFVLMFGSLCFVRLGVELFRHPDKLPPIVTGLAFASVFTAAMSGAVSAELDRIATFEETASSQPRCGKFAILRSIGDHFLAVSAEDTRVLIDADCKPKFVLHAKYGQPNYGDTTLTG